MCKPVLRRPCQRVLSLLVLWTLLCLPSFGQGTTWHVRVDGDDGRDGLTPATAFRTISHGGKAVKAGDTLLIGPGEYYESVELRLAGDAEKRTYYRAEIPGTVLIRGDREVSGFRPVPGYRFVYETDWKEPVNAVNERDSMKIYLPAATVRELEFVRGVWYRDEAAGKLYISTSDGQPPEAHYLTVSVIMGNGFLVRDALNVEVDGLMVTGFYSHYPVRNGPSNSLQGIYLMSPQHSMIRNCTAFFNSNGIILGAWKSEKSVIAGCTAYVNGSRQPTSGGNIIAWGPCRENVIRDSLSFFSSNPGNQPQGIRIYGGDMVDCLIDRCTSFGEDFIYIKGIDKNSWCTNTYSERGLAARGSRNNVFNNRNSYNEKDSSLSLNTIKKERYDELFADPDNHDFRPQGDAEGIAHGLPDDKNLYFVSPDGDDSRAGHSLKTAWRTLQNIRPDTTVFLLPGQYAGGEIKADRVILKTRGSGARAVIHGGLQVSGEGVQLLDVNFIGKPVMVSGGDCLVRGCGFAVPLQVRGARPRLLHNAFAAAPELAGTAGVRHSNLYLEGTRKPVPPGWVDFEREHAVPELIAPAQGDFTVRNPQVFAGRGFDALPLGPYRLVREIKPVVVTGPFVRSVTDTTANIEWWTDSDAVTSELLWGEDESCSRRFGQPFSGSFYHTMTLTGLQAGKTYYFKIASRSPIREHHANMELSILDRNLERADITSAVMPLTTLAVAAAPRTLRVRIDGDDQGEGTEGSPWRTISRALDAALAGDTVEVGAGSYTETLYFRSGGDRQRPLTVRAAPGAKVWLDGTRVVKFGMIIDNKSHLLIDGFYFRDLNGGAGIQINGGSDITIQRCFYDGRCSGYTPEFIKANMVRRLTVANSFVTRGFHGASFMRCPDLLIRNTVWFNNQINHFYIHNLPNEPAVLRQNIFFENIPGKFRGPLIGCHHVEAIRESDNCYYLRRHQDKRKLISFTRFEGDILRIDATYAEFLPYAGLEATALFTDPQVPAVDAYMIFQNQDDPSAEVAEMGTRHAAVELKEVKGEGYTPWDFSDFMPKNPECIRRRIGFEPEMFPEVKP